MLTSDVIVPPEIGSVWRNLKKGTIYRVWAIATDANNPPQQFVIYQEPSFRMPRPVLRSLLMRSHKANPLN